jgi:hypothetical protein
LNPGTDGSGPGGWDGNSEAGANDGGERIGYEDDGDYLEEMLRAIGSKGLENFEKLKKNRMRVWMLLKRVEKACGTANCLGYSVLYSLYLIVVINTG